MQPTQTATFLSGSTWSQAYGWTSILVQDLRHRHTNTGWSATAIPGIGSTLSSTAIWNATAVWGTVQRETGHSSLEASHLAIYGDGRRAPAIRPERNLPPDAFLASGGWNLW